MESFRPADGACRLDATLGVNKVYFAALFRHMQVRSGVENDVEVEIQRGLFLPTCYTPYFSSTKILHYLFDLFPPPTPLILNSASILDVGNGGRSAHRIGSGPASVVSRSAWRPHGLSASTGHSRIDQPPRRSSARTPPVEAADRPLSFRRLKGFRICGGCIRSELSICKFPSFSCLASCVISELKVDL